MPSNVSTSKNLVKKNQNMKDPRAQAVVGGDIFSPGHDFTYGLDLDAVTPQGPLHGEASSSNADVGKPRQRNRSMKRVAKGRQPGFTGG